MDDIHGSHDAIHVLLDGGVPVGRCHAGIGRWLMLSIDTVPYW